MLQLSTELRQSGIDVILDKWDLREGHDAHSFMEQMVTKPDIKKVILVCDRAYVEKTDQRTGGVGTEAQIISGELYAKSEQEKFVAVVREKDDDGSPCLPAYYKSRIYIDLSEASSYSDNFDRLIRWALDKPLYKKPDLGAVPGYLAQDEGSVTLATTPRFRRAIEAIRSNRDYADGAVIDYLNCFSEELERLRLGSADGEFDERVIESIESFLPYRNELIEVIEALAQYRDTEESRRALHRFLERLIPYMERTREVTRYSEWDFDNFRFIVHEVFLYCVAILIRQSRFESAAYLPKSEYYLPGRSDYGRDVMVSFDVFRQPMRSLEYRKQRLKLPRLSLRADMLEQRCRGISVPFRDLLQADFVLFLRNLLDHPDQQWYWWPETLLYVSRHSGPFEIFARSKWSSYFDQVKVLLGVQSKDELAPMLESFRSPNARLPRWEGESFSPRTLLGLDDICAKP